MSKARYIMIGGFLGAGKTTLLSKFARYLTDQNISVGLITNDQAENLVDSKILKSHGYNVEEIAGGCFCCRFNSLKDAADNLSQEHHPDIFIAEPVGSCTDLIATVSYPLRRLYGDDFTITALTVLLDPARAMRIFGLSSGKAFSKKVRYIYQKQIEESDFVVINKSDTLSDSEQQELRQVLHDRYPDKTIFFCSAQNDDGLHPLFEAILKSERQIQPAMEMDYQTYAEGEAELGWLNATLSLQSHKNCDGNNLIEDLCHSLRDFLAEQDVDIAHLKMTLAPDTMSTDLAVIQYVGADTPPTFTQSLQDALLSGELIVNLRAHSEPKILHRALVASIEPFKSCLTLIHEEHFAPEAPVPVHRDN